MATNHKKVKLEHIALACGVSKITVSRTLSDPSKVKPETRNKILSAAQKMGYFSPHSNNVRKHNKLIGIINPNMQNPFFGRLAQLMTKISVELNYDILMFDSYESAQIEQQSIQKLIEYGADAIILSTISSDRHYQPSYLQQLDELNIPVILLDREIGDGKYNGIYIDNLHCGVEAANYFNQSAYEDIVVIAGPASSRVSSERISGFISTLSADKKLSLSHADFFMDEAYTVAKNYLEKNHRPLAFLGLNNQISLGILKACIEKQLVFKKDFDLFSIDNVPYAEVFGFHIPCISHNLYEIAYQAIQLAMRTLSSNEKPSRIIIRGDICL
ncbi:LacI family DNA-binding transcriptional regulator [Avibacterium avium]|uniref:LacI family DNA-binding transcriptional regulator n=1 Tax=Avibacterium avium TaxID=751 RepID=UPI003BF7F645